MYYVLNPDGNRYGPVSLAALQQWYHEGRIIDAARFLDAATEEIVPRERLLPPATSQSAYYPPSSRYPGTPPYGQGYSGQSYPQQPHQGQAYRDVPMAQQPRLYDHPTYGYPPNPYLTGYYATGNPSHSPVAACILAFFCIIAGYIYNKQVVKGLLFMVAGIVLGYFIGWFSVIWTIFCMIDCYKVGQRVQSGETVGEFKTL